MIGRDATTKLLMKASIRSLLTTAGICMFVSVFCASITLASQDYRAILVVGIACLIIADSCCILAFLSGEPYRWIALVIALPSLLVVNELWRRLPPAFGLL
jgi:hypothetical protein